MQLDLFEKPKKSKPSCVLSEEGKKERMRAEYKRYISSAEWEKRRELFVAIKGGKCERCGSIKALEVHHPHYRTFGKERSEDVEIVCENCHIQADLERSERGRNRSEDALEAAMYEGMFLSYLATKYGNEDLAKDASFGPNERIGFEEWYDR